MNDLITIVVPIYNVEQFLERCIKSLVNQTYKNVEIMLVNDGSPDNSDKIMEKWAKKDNRIKCFYKENGGLSDARNYAIKRAQGKYICFIDSDDYIDKNYVKKLYNAIIENNAEIAWCNFNNVNDEEIVGKIIQNEDDLWSFEMPSACNKLFLKDLFIKNNIEFPKGIWYEDLATTPRLFFKAKKSVWVNDELYNYFYNEDSITKTYCKRALEVKEGLTIVYDFCLKNGLLENKNIYEKLEYMFLYSELNTAFRASMAKDLSYKDIKDFTYWCESKFEKIYKNKIAKKRLNFTRKTLLILIRLRLFRLLGVVIRFVKGISKK